MRMLVTGREGQIVRSLAERAAGTDNEIIALGRPELDLAGSSAEIMSAIAAVNPDIVVSAAAYTKVDEAEGEHGLAFAVNEHGPRAVAKAARELGVPLIHLSTDYVFNGLKASPYVEDDPTGPTGVYGISKLAGEQAVLAEHGDSVVLRTAWVYSPFAANFVKTMLRLAGDREEVAIVADQRGNPSSAFDIADGIFAIATNLKTTDDPDQRGIFHMAGSGEATWAEFAEGIFEVSAALGGPSAKVRHIATADYPTAAKRPPNSRLDCSKVARTHGVRLPEWHSAIDQVICKLLMATRNGGMNQ